MAASAAIVPRDGLVLSVGRVLETPELAGLVEDLVALRRSPRGRPGYTTRSLLGACLVKSLYELPTWSPDETRFHVILRGELVQSFRTLGPAQETFRRLRDESGWEVPTQKELSAEERIRREQQARDRLGYFEYWRRRTSIA